MQKKLNNLEITKASLPSSIPLFPLGGALLLPNIELPLNVFEPRYINMVDDALAEKKLIGIIQPKNTLISKLSSHKPLYQTGCLGKIKAYNETDDGRYLIVLSGITRFKIKDEIPTTRGYRRFQVNYEEFDSDFDNQEARKGFNLSIEKLELLNKVNKYLQGSEKKASLNNIKGLDSTQDGFLVDFLCSYLPFNSEEKQLFLEAKTVSEREESLYNVLGIAEAEAKFNTNSKILH